MLVIKNSSLDPYFNLAAEEYMLKSTDEDVFMLWQNERSVIIGKNQNVWAEVNTRFARQNNIKVARRMTGGGAVFHDAGNVNFTFITNATEENKLNFAVFLEPVCKALSEMGITAETDGRNDLICLGYKISGSAECVARSESNTERILHHGTLLFASDLGALSEVLTPSKKKLMSKGIKSVSSRVANISELDGYTGPDSAGEFINALFEKISPRESPRRFTSAEEENINKLAKEKYALDEWIYGAAPVFDISNEMRFSFGTLTSSTVCEKGKIAKVKIEGDFFGSEDVKRLENELVGVPFMKKDIFERLMLCENLLKNCISGATAQDIAALIAAEYDD